MLAIHCILHRHNLVAKCFNNSLHESLNLAVKAVNKIKSSGLNHRLFKTLCNENNEEFERLLLHTEVRWLSKGNFLDRFCNLFDSVVQFLTEKDPELGSKIVQSHCDIMYLADFFEKMNDVCTKLQGKEISLIQCKCTIAGFAGRLDV